eukprot:6772677-Pyramimonas_sp.AAC.2
MLQSSGTTCSQGGQLAQPRTSRDTALGSPGRSPAVMPDTKVRPVPVGRDGSGNVVALSWASRSTSRCSQQLIMPCAIEISRLTRSSVCLIGACDRPGRLASRFTKQPQGQAVRGTQGASVEEIGENANVGPHRTTPSS